MERFVFFCQNPEAKYLGIHVCDHFCLRPLFLQSLLLQVSALLTFTLMLTWPNKGILIRKTHLTGHSGKLLSHPSGGKTSATENREEQDCMYQKFYIAIEIYTMFSLCA